MHLFIESSLANIKRNLILIQMKSCLYDVIVEWVLSFMHGRGHGMWAKIDTNSTETTKKKNNVLEVRVNK